MSFSSTICNDEMSSSSCVTVVDPVSKRDKVSP